MILGIDASRANVREKTGVEWYAWRIIQELKRIIPQDVRVVLYSREPLEGLLADLPPLWESRIVTTPFNRLWTHVGLSLEMLKEKPDVLFVPAHVVPIIHPRTVITLHDVASERCPEVYSRFQRLYHKWSTRFALRHAHTVIAPSRFTAQEICDLFGHPHCDLEVIHLGADSFDGSETCTEEQNSVSIPQDPYILYVGRLGRKKGLDDLIRAFELVKEDDVFSNIRLVVVGPRGYGSQELESKINRSPYREHIHRLGWLSEKDKQALLKSSRIFVFPTHYEGFGIPILEAAACGVPVVARRTGSLPEIAGQDLVRWFDNDAQLSTVLKEALQDVDWHVHVKKQGPGHATRFSWRASALRTWEVLNKALRF